MKVVTVVSSTHRLYLEKYFLPTFPWEFNIDLIICNLPNLCPSGNFMQAGFNEICRQKLIKVNEMCSRFANEVILYCDVDVMFYTHSIVDPIMMALEDKDMVFINEGNNQYCTGVIGMRANHQVRGFLCYLDGLIGKCRDDQDAVNLHIRDEGFEDLRHGFLPDTFFGIGKDFGYWPREEDDKPIVLPDKMILHHGNFATGMRSKMALLEHVKSLWKQQ